MRLFRSISLAVLVMLAPLRPAAADAVFPEAPILRPEIGVHTAPTVALAVDDQRGELVTGSLDKTVRVWNLDSGSAKAVFRLPLGRGDVGKVASLALSPDGTSIAVGGWASDAEGGAPVYILDRNTGGIRHVVRDLPDTAMHLAYSPDGRFLAVATVGPHDVAVMETAGYTVVGHATAPGSRGSGIAFDAQNDLLAGDRDGRLARYGENLQVHAAREFRQGRHLIGPVFRPGHRTVAVGFRDAADVLIVDAGTLEPTATLALPAGWAGTDLLSWTGRGDRLYAAGRGPHGGAVVLRRWDMDRPDSPVDVPVGDDTVQAMQATADGGGVLATAEGALLRLDAEGGIGWRHWRPLADFREQNGPSGLRVSQDGRTISFGLVRGGSEQVRFDAQGPLLRPAPVPDPLLRPVEMRTLDVALRSDLPGGGPALNGKPLEMWENDAASSYAIVLKTRRVLLGSHWFLTLYDHDGNVHWRVDTPGTAWAVTASGDGRLAVVGFSDGTIRWYRIADGRELLALLVLRDGTSWVAWTPDGHHAASDTMRPMLGWHVNRGDATAPEFLKRDAWRPNPNVGRGVTRSLDDS